MSSDRFSWREIELTLDDDTIFTFPLRLRNEEVQIVWDCDLRRIAERGRLSDAEDVKEVITQLLHRNSDIGNNEEPADDFYRKCLGIWEAWDRR